MVPVFLAHTFVEDDASYKYHENEGVIGWILLSLRPCRTNSWHFGDVSRFLVRESFALPDDRLGLYGWFLWAVQSSAREAHRVVNAGMQIPMWLNEPVAPRSFCAVRSGNCDNGSDWGDFMLWRRRFSHHREIMPEGGFKIANFLRQFRIAGSLPDSICFLVRWLGWDMDSVLRGYTSLHFLLAPWDSDRGFAQSPQHEQAPSLSLPNASWMLLRPYSWPGT